MGICTEEELLVINSFINILPYIIPITHIYPPYFIPTDDKGPIIATIFAVKELQLQHAELGVNIVFVYEGEEEADSEGFAETITQYKAWFDRTEVVIYLKIY